MSAALTLLAPAKMNFSLEVLGLRRDGYHDVRMLMAGLDLYDELSFRPASQLSLYCQHPGLDCGASNLVIRAARLLQKRYGVAVGARIHLVKRIPLGGGLAGGSSDAAATLKGLNKLWRLRLKPAELAKLAASLGSDIPFCLESGWALATGRGEKLRPLEMRRSIHVLLANPGFEVSTKWAYAHVSPRLSRRNLSRLAFQAIADDDPALLARASVNELAVAVSRKYPDINYLKSLMVENGALASQMSGSGPTVWGLFKDETASHSAQKIIRNHTDFCVAAKTIRVIPKLQ